MVKRQGYLTVEATLLLIISFSLFSVLFSVGVVFEKNLQVYNMVESASENAANMLYAVNRLGSAVSENGKTFVSDENSLATLITNGISEGLSDMSCRGTAALIAFDFNYQLNQNVSSLDNLWLKQSPNISVSLADDAILVESEKIFKLRGIFLFKNELKFKDRHLIPLKDARSLIVGSDVTSDNQVYLTNYGKTKTFVYHSTRDCMGFRRVKHYDTYTVDKSEIGSEVEIEGKLYHHCPFCTRIKSKEK